MRTVVNNKQTTMNKYRANDLGKMRRVGESIQWKLIEQINLKHTKIK